MDDPLYGFELLQERAIPELNTRGRLFRHLDTGAQLLSLENDDENKVFSINFRTPPADSTGVAHIMEHSVLCGSRKYPVKEPFVELLKGSLQTFVNAFTFPDRTCYPLASQNLKDFYNLIDVYIDAVFYPLIPPHTLQQEGWHYELENPDQPLTYKGVVYNEMKGAYSNPDDVLSDMARASLFPNTPYGVDSGGDPRHIPDLTYAAFKGFHERYYHPSNAYIFFYGNDDPQERLRRMAEYLAPFQAIRVDSEIPLQPRFDRPRRQEAFFDPGDDPENARGRLVVSWLLADTADPETMLGLSALNHILLGTPASPLRKALIDSGLGEDLAGGGLDDELRQSFFSTGLQGLAVDDGRLRDGETVERLVLDTLERLARQGIESEQVAASLNTLEFRMREFNFGSFPRGVVAMIMAMVTWLYGGDPFDALAFEAPLRSIHARLSGGERYFETLIERYFLGNPHRTTVTLLPRPGLTQEQEADERRRLEQARAMMDAAQLQQIVADTRWLKERQVTPDTPEALATIPGLRLEDMERQARLIPLEVSSLGGTQLLYHDLFTNGIVYLDLGLDLHSLPQELLPYVPLYGRALLGLGAAGDDYVRLAQRIGRSTGGIYPTTFTTQTRRSERAQAWFFLRGKATLAQSADLLRILSDVLLAPRFDTPERFRQIVLEEKAGLESSLAPAGHRLVASRLKAHFNESDWADELMGGIEQLFFLRELAQQVEQDWPAVLARLQAVHAALLNRQSALVNLTLDAAGFAQLRPQLADFLAALPGESTAGGTPAIRQLEWRRAALPPAEGLTFPAQVNFVGKAADLYRLGYQLDGSVHVINKYLGTTWLWERVRVQGGAYGGFCTFNHRSGVYAFLSYRDPNLLGTLENYDGTAAFLRSLDLSQEELTRSIIGTIGDLDAYQLPDAKGYTSMARYLAGDSDQERQLWREQVLSTTAADFRAFGDILEQLNRSGEVVVLGSADAIGRANRERGDFLQPRKVL
ncbi:MAG: insulinase family protein [Chloroflexota bacterium]